MAIIPSDQKFHTVPAEVDTKDKGSARANADREIFTMQDIVDSVTVGGGIDFTELGDTPSVYSGAAGQAAIVNPTEDGLIFGPAGAESLIELNDTPAGYGTNGQVLMTNGSNAATWEDAPSPIGIDTGFITRDAAYSSIGDHEGTVLTIGPVGALAQVHYWDGTAWVLANASAAATASGFLCLGTAAAGDALVNGIMQLGTAPGSAGDVLYLDTTNGQLTATAPSTSGDIVRVLGYNLGGNRVYFDPSKDWLEIV